MYLKNADKVSHETLSEQIEKFLNEGNQIKYVEKQQRSMLEFVWWMDEYPKRRGIKK